MRSHSFLLAICSVACKLLVAVEQPTITLKEGLPAKIPCMVKGVADAYFWRRGEHLNISDEIATIVFGVPGVVSDAFRVTEDGTLMIFNVTTAIEGRYFCRISTKDNAYFSDVMVLVQVLFDDFGFGIEQCYPKETCTLQVEPYTTTNLTCTATGVPSSLSLKWYNGSDVITSVASEHSSNEESSTVSETITVPNEFGLPLTCEAAVRDDGQACARFVHVRLDKTDKAKEQTDADKSSALWIVLLVLLVVETVFTVFLLKYIYARKKYAQRNKRTSEQEGLLKTATEELKEQLAEKDETLKNTTAELEKVTEDLKNKTTTLTTTTEELKKQLTERKEALKKTTKKLQKQLTEKKKALKNTTAELKKVTEDLKKKTTPLTTTTEELKKHLTEREQALKTTTEELKKQLTETEEALKTTTEELRKQLTEREEALKTTTEELQKQLTETEEALKNTAAELEKVTEDLKKKATTLTKSIISRLSF